MSPRRLKLGIHVGSGQMYRVYRNQLLLLICPFIPSFYLSNFQTLKFFVTLLPRRLKLCTQVDGGQMYGVYPIQAAAFICPFFLSLQFSNIKIFHHALLWNYET